MNHELQVDVILPFHRVDRYLLWALDSVEGSNKLRPRLILIDDRKIKEKSPKLESKLKMLKKCDVVYLENFNHGYGNAINLGITRILNPWVALMNSDDLISEDRLYNQILAIKKSNSDGAICKLTKFTGFKFIRIPSVLGKISIDSYNSSYLLLGSYGADATLVLKAEKFRNLNFSTAELCGDWITALYRYPEMQITGVPTSNYFYRIHSKQSSNLRISSNKILLQEIFDSWTELNSSLGLPKVTFDEFIYIAAPWARSKENTPSRERFNFWFEQYLQLNHGSRDIKSLRLAHKRRLLFLDFHGKNFSKVLVPLSFTIFGELVYKKLLGALSR